MYIILTMLEGIEYAEVSCHVRYIFTDVLLTWYYSSISLVETESAAYFIISLHGGPKCKLHPHTPRGQTGYCIFVSRIRKWIELTGQDSADKVAEPAFSHKRKPS